MSTSFALINGDLVISPGRKIQTVSNKDKLAQDLRLWILERFGVDPDNPTWGSHLGEFVGQTISASTVNSIRNEIIRLLQQYQAMQVANMQREVIQFQGKTTLDPSEVLNSIDSVNVISQGTTILARVQLTTLAGATLQITLPIQ